MPTWTLGAGQAGAVVSSCSPPQALSGARCQHVIRLSLRFVTVDTFSTGEAPSRVVGALLASASPRGTQSWSLMCACLLFFLVFCTLARVSREVADTTST